MGEITDGTSNVMMLGEQSDFALDSTGQRADCRAASCFGAWIGTTMVGQRVDGSPYDNRVFQTVTIGRPLNSRSCDYVGDYTTITSMPEQPWIGIVANADNRTPILSAHFGGAHVAMCDGSVHWLSELIAFDLFQAMAIRDSNLTKYSFP
jgi:hypothetical protein